MDAMKRRPTAILEDKQPDTAYVMDASGQGLRAQFYRSRVIGGAVAVAAVIGTIMLLLQGDGVRIESFDKDDKGDDAIKDLVDNYNSISGSLGSFISKPIEFFLGLLVSAAFLCFATDFTLSKSNDGHWKYIPVLAGAAITYLFSNGLNALNVQVVSGKINICMGIDDLTSETAVEDMPVDNQLMLPNGSLPMPWRSTYAETVGDNDILNTILRSKIMPIENLNSACNSTGFRDVTEPFASTTVVAFGFPSRTWYKDVLTKAEKPAKVLKIGMNMRVSDLPSDAELPSSVSVSRGLVNVGVRVLNDLFYGMNQTDNPTVPTTGTSFVNASHATWLSVFNVTKGAMVKDATVEYTRFQLSEKITYDAVTFELPVVMVQRDKFGTVVNPVNGSNELYVKDYCSREACLIPPAENTILNKTSTVQSRVQVTTICLNKDGVEDEMYSTPPCEHVSLSSMRVVSIGTRLVGDVWDLDYRTEDEVMRFKNLRTVYSITIGRLAWETEDLAEVFGAKCANSEDNGDCIGLRYKLTPYWPDEESDYLAVGMDSLPIVKLTQYTLSGYGKWVYLVTGADGLGEERYEVLRARNFANVTASGGSLRAIAADRCNTFSDDYIRAVERNHLYMEHSLQPSYTSAFLYLFQNAVPVRRTVPYVSATSMSGKKSSLTTTKFGKDSILSFKANKQVMDVMVSVPTTNAIVSLAGCVVVLVASVGIVMRAKKSEQQLQERANVGIVTEAIMNTSKHPPWLLNLALEQAAAAYAQEHQELGHPPQEERVRVVLQDLRVQSVNLQHSRNADHAFHVGTDMYK